MHILNACNYRQTKMNAKLNIIISFFALWRIIIILVVLTRYEPLSVLFIPAELIKMIFPGGLGCSILILIWGGEGERGSNG